MKDILLLRFDAPMMSFGGIVIDQHGFTMDFPVRSMLAGLLANALGWDHAEAERTRALQTQLRHGSRRDVPGIPLRDYQTVDLRRPFMQEGWTTRGHPEGREGAKSSDALTYIRLRHYLSDAEYTVAFTLEVASGLPSLDDCEAALRRPARPLFLGRKCSIPSGPLLLGRLRAPGLKAALEQAEFSPRARRFWNAEASHGTRGSAERVTLWWPEEEGGDFVAKVAVSEERDWRNQVFAGRGYVCQGSMEAPSVQRAEVAQ